MTQSPIIALEDFLKVDLRVGTVTRAEPFPEARKPAIKIWVDFGPAIGEKKSSAQITRHYSAEALVGKQICGLVNIASRQIGPFRSEFLCLGFEDGSGGIILIGPDQAAPNGERLC